VTSSPEDYLRDWNGNDVPYGREYLPVTSVSCFAAAAYCDWFTKRAQAAFPGTISRLPRESEWEWAARGNLRGMPYPLGEKAGHSVFFEKGIAGPSRAGTSEPNGYGLRDMMGNVWEWCGGGFGPADYLLTSHDPRANADAIAAHPLTDDRPVRGGGWSGLRELSRVYTRGAQPASWCTPYLGFRVAIARP
jgi:formylglycine-generating enzyme required for sulfatase activity